MKKIAKKMWAMDFGSLGVGEFICPKCGRPITLADQVCAHCGYDLVAYRKAHHIKQPPLSATDSAAAPSRATGNNFGTIDFGDDSLASAKIPRQLTAVDVVESDAAPKQAHSTVAHSNISQALPPQSKAASFEAAAISDTAHQAATRDFQTASTKAPKNSAQAVQVAQAPSEETDTFDRAAAAQLTSADAEFDTTAAQSLRSSSEQATKSAAESTQMQQSETAQGTTSAADALDVTSLAQLVAQVQSDQATVKQLLAKMQTDQAALHQFADQVSAANSTANQQTAQSLAALTAHATHKAQRKNWFVRLWRRLFRPHQRRLPAPKQDQHKTNKENG